MRMKDVRTAAQELVRDFWVPVEYRQAMVDHICRLACQRADTAVHEYISNRKGNYGS